MSETFQAQAVRRPWSEAVATFLTCLMLGPPLGGIAFGFSIVMTPFFSGVPLADGTTLGSQLYTGLIIALFGIPFSYLIGGIQAAATGVFLAVFGWMRGRPPLWFALATAVAVFAGAALADIAETSETLTLMIPVHAVPTLLCWLIIRNYWREKLA